MLRNQVKQITNESVALTVQSNDSCEICGKVNLHAVSHYYFSTFKLTSHPEWDEVAQSEAGALVGGFYTRHEELEK
jgi:hypothetical protein